MKEQLTDRVNFDFIRYANCWEDAEILLEGLSARAGDRILSVASAGDNSFFLLTADPEIVVAVDVNAVQLYLVELKQACFKILDRNEMLSFLGFRDSSSRKEIFLRLKPVLSNEAVEYWEQHLHLIENGVIHQGKFEKYFQLFSKKILPWIHSRKTTARLFLPKTEEEQEKFYAKTWNSWRWRLLFKIFFSKSVMGKRGRDPEFLKEVKVNVSDYIFGKAEKQLNSKLAQHNFILRYNLTGNFGDQLPAYLQEENYGKIKANIDRLFVFKGYAEDACNHFGKFDCMNLSNIFEYLDTETFKKVAGGIVDGCNPGARIAYWNLMVPRKVSELFPAALTYEKTLSEKLSERDKGFFYNKFIVEKVK